MDFFSTNVQEKEVTINHYLWFIKINLNTDYLIIKYQLNYKYVSEDRAFDSTGYKYSTITFEIPCSIEQNPGEYYYPVQTKESKKIYKLYCKLASKKRKITFCGRTGLYRYIDMIPAVMMHLKIANDFLKKNR